jgi:octanoyl-[GcvH]:protein N-octanoyltransferase
MAKPDISSNFPLLRFDQAWTLKDFDGRGDLPRRATFDERLLDHVIKGEIGPCLCIYRAPQCLVTTVRESRMNNFAEACRALAAEGWPVIVRCTGGSCVPQGPGVINFSIIHPKIRGWYLDDGYKLLCDFLTHFLASYGLTVTTGEIPGSFCDGRYNLQIGGQKLVGTAQRWTGGSRDNASVLAHACLLVDINLAEATEKINTLYRLCDNPQQFTLKSSTTLLDCLGGPGHQTSAEFVTDVEGRLTAMAKDYFNLSH